MARKTRALPKTPQKRGCANVLVPRDDVLDAAGRVPKGCRFVKGGDVMCTPAMAEKAGVIAVKREKQVRRRSKTSSKKKASSKKTSRRYCYNPDSPHPFLKKKVKGRKKLKKDCKKDPETEKICCPRSVAPKRRKGSKGQQRLPGVNGVDEANPIVGHIPFIDATPPRTTPPGPGLALLDDGDLDLPQSTDLALLDESTQLEPLPADVVMPEPEHLSEFGDFAMMYLGGTVVVGAGLWGTYELIDRIEWFDDKPAARAGAFIGAGAIPALTLWASADTLSKNYASEIRTFAAAWGIAISAVGVLGLIRSVFEQQAKDTDDPEQRSSLEDIADSIPWYPPQPDVPTDGGDDGGGTGGDGDDGEIVTDTGGEGGEGDDAGPGTSGYPYPYPGRRRFR